MGVITPSLRTTGLIRKFDIEFDFTYLFYTLLFYQIHYNKSAYQILYILENENFEFSKKKSAAKYFEIGWIDLLKIFTYVSWDPCLPLLVTIFLLSMKII